MDKILRIYYILVRCKVPSKDSDIEVQLFQNLNLKKFEWMDLQDGVYKLW